jgi:hypothetical protein
MGHPSSRDRSERQGSARTSASASGHSSTSMTPAPTYCRREEIPGIGGSYQGGASFYRAPYDPQSSVGGWWETTPLWQLRDDWREKCAP